MTTHNTNSNTNCNSVAEKFRRIVQRFQAASPPSTGGTPAVVGPAMYGSLPYRPTGVDHVQGYTIVRFSDGDSVHLRGHFPQSKAFERAVEIRKAEQRGKFPAKYGRWVTMGGGEGEGSGGARVFIEDDGTIAAGPAALTGKKIGELKGESKGKEVSDGKKKVEGKKKTARAKWNAHKEDKILELRRKELDSKGPIPNFKTLTKAKEVSLGDIDIDSIDPDGWVKDANTGEVGVVDRIGNGKVYARPFSDDEMRRAAHHYWTQPKFNQGEHLAFHTDKQLANGDMPAYHNTAYSLKLMASSLQHGPKKPGPFSSIPDRVNGILEQEFDKLPAKEKKAVARGMGIDDSGKLSDIRKRLEDKFSKTYQAKWGEWTGRDKEAEKSAETAKQSAEQIEKQKKYDRAVSNVSHDIEMFTRLAKQSIEKGKPDDIDNLAFMARTHIGSSMADISDDERRQIADKFGIDHKSSSNIYKSISDSMFKRIMDLKPKTPIQEKDWKRIINYSRSPLHSALSSMVRAISSSNPAKYGRWITIGGSKEEGEDGETKGRGGARVYIEDDGTITAGPGKLEGKKIGELDKNVAGTAKDKRKENEPPGKKGKGEKKKVTTKGEATPSKWEQDKAAFRQKLKESGYSDEEVNRYVSKVFEEQSGDEKIQRKAIDDAEARAWAEGRDLKGASKPEVNPDQPAVGGWKRSTPEEDAEANAWAEGRDFRGASKPEVNPEQVAPATGGWKKPTQSEVEEANAWAEGREYKKPGEGKAGWTKSTPQETDEANAWAEGRDLKQAAPTPIPAPTPAPARPEAEEDWQLTRDEWWNNQGVATDLGGVPDEFKEVLRQMEPIKAKLLKEKYGIVQGNQMTRVGMTFDTYLQRLKETEAEAFLQVEPYWKMIANAISSGQNVPQHIRDEYHKLEEEAGRGKPQEEDTPETPEEQRKRLEKKLAQYRDWSSKAPQDLAKKYATKAATIERKLKKLDGTPAPARYSRFPLRSRLFRTISRVLAE